MSRSSKDSLQDITKLLSRHSSLQEEPKLIESILCLNIQRSFSNRSQTRNRRVSIRTVSRASHQALVMTNLWDRIRLWSPPLESSKSTVLTESLKVQPIRKRRKRRRRRVCTCHQDWTDTRPWVIWALQETPSPRDLLKKVPKIWTCV